MRVNKLIIDSEKAYKQILSGDDSFHLLLSLEPFQYLDMNLREYKKVYEDEYSDLEIVSKELKNCIVNKRKYNEDPTKYSVTQNYWYDKVLPRIISFLEMIVDDQSLKKVLDQFNIPDKYDKFIAELKPTDFPEYEKEVKIRGIYHQPEDLKPLGEKNQVYLEEKLLEDVVRARTYLATSIRKPFKRVLREVLSEFKSRLSYDATKIDSQGSEAKKLYDRILKNKRFLVDPIRWLDTIIYLDKTSLHSRIWEDLLKDQIPDGPMKDKLKEKLVFQRIHGTSKNTQRG